MTMEAYYHYDNPMYDAHEARMMAFDAECDAIRQDEENEAKRKAEAEADQASWEAERGIGSYIPFSDEQTESCPF